MDALGTIKEQEEHEAFMDSWLAWVPCVTLAHLYEKDILTSFNYSWSAFAEDADLSTHSE